MSHAPNIIRNADGAVIVESPWPGELWITEDLLAEANRKIVEIEEPIKAGSTIRFNCRNASATYRLREQRPWPDEIWVADMVEAAWDREVRP